MLKITVKISASNTLINVIYLQHTVLIEKKISLNTKCEQNIYIFFFIYIKTLKCTIQTHKYISNCIIFLP